MSIKVLLLSGLVACVILLSGCGVEEPERIAKVVPAPEIDLPLAVSGPPVSLSSMRGKVVVLDFWATWCGPCKMSMPELEQIYEKYRKKGVVVIGISEDSSETSDRIAATKKDLGITYPTLLATEISGIEEKYPHSGIPMLYLIDQKGNIGMSFQGYDSDHGLTNVEAKIDELLKQ